MLKKYAMSRFIVSSNLSQLLNILGLLGISLSLTIAFYYQLWQHELPCPLCLLQRAGLICIGLGFLMNIRFGEHNLHYGLSIISAIISGSVSIRQILLHIVPGSGSYGSTFLGIHFYTWGLFASVSAITFIALLLILNTLTIKTEPDKGLKTSGKIAMAIFTLIVAANLGSVLLECGFGKCADNPMMYQMLNINGNLS